MFKVVCISIVLLHSFLAFSVNVANASEFDEVTFKERVESRWSDIEKFNFKKLYTFESPAFKKAFPLELYVNKFSRATSRRLTKIIEVKYDKVKGLAVALVDIETGSRVSASNETNVVSVELEEHWLFIEGKWWYISSSS
jgi:hypothetical protein